MGNMFPVKARASRSAKTKAMLAPPDPLNAPVKAEPEESRWENYMPGIAVVSSEPAFLHCFGASDKEDILCLAPASKGRRCRKKRVVGNYCKQHYQEWSALEKKKKKICDAVSKVFLKAVESWRHHLQDLVFFLFGRSIFLTRQLKSQMLL